MPVREQAFRIGCGRYLQKPDLLKECGAEIARLGKAPLIVGGKTALSVARPKMEKSVEEYCQTVCWVEHRGTCNHPAAQALAQQAQQQGLDVVVGVGGGVLMDLAKLVGDYAGLPVINIPTSSATCAAYTPLSVCYTPEGETVGTTHFGYEVSAVLVDTAVLAAQPPRLLLAGVFDALAKFVEIKHRFNETVTDYPLGLDWAYGMAKGTFDQLIRHTSRCLEDMAAGRITDTVERVVFATIAVTGVISGIARGSNQTALAHKFYECTRTLFPVKSRPYLHGEIVGVGLLLQNHFNKELQHNDFLLQMMKEYQMPGSLPDLGLEPTDGVRQQYYDLLKVSSAIEESRDEELTRLGEGLCYLFELKGRSV